MGTDLFRITMSSGIVRNRYMAALLSTTRSTSKRGIPECLLPGKLASNQSDKANASVRTVAPKRSGN